ncbi:hypothetical protein F5146DRAFT_1120077 [Armillaria mellea]|nr:hypothetical protein F5146DRAFT_1120077 [Armillaria mellea]
MPESTSSRASSPGTPAHGQAAAIHKPTYAQAVTKPYREALKLRLDLNLEVEISIKAKVNGDITLSLLVMESKKVKRSTCTVVDHVRLLPFRYFYMQELLNRTVSLPGWVKSKPSTVMGTSLRAVGRKRRDHT